MRLGPGKHLQGLTLMGGAVKPEEVRPMNEPLGDFRKRSNPQSSSLITFTRYALISRCIPYLTRI